jgi:hypothetical protein
MCGLYNEKCEILCTKIIDEMTCETSGSGYCFWISGENTDDNGCVNKV